MKRFKGLTMTMLAVTLIVAAPVFAESRGGHGGGGFSHGGGASHFSGRSFSAPARGFSGGARGFEGRGFPNRGFDRGYIRGGALDFGVGVYPGYAYRYSYGSPYYYDPNYAEPPYYAAPAPVPACNPNGGYYDANGSWVPDPNCQVPPVAGPVPYGY